ncbi:trigger factor [Chloroflexota bacterium]
MKVSAERIEGCQVVLNVEVDDAEMEESLGKASRRLAARANIPGFRKGKAPRAMVERFLGRGALLEDAIENMLPEVYNSALEEQGVEAIAQPEIEIIQTEPMSFKATVPVRPTMELGDYRQVRATQEEIEVTDADIDEAIERIRHQQAPWEPVEREVRSGDMVTMDAEGTVEGQTVLEQKGRNHYLVPEWPFLPPGFAEKLEGMVKGEEREFTLTLPEGEEELAGKEALFKVSISEVKEKLLSELNDEFVKGLGEESIETVEGLRERLTTDLKAARQQMARRNLEDEIIGQVVAISKLEFPDILVEREVDRLIANEKARMGNAQMSTEEYLERIGRTEEELKEDLRPQASEGVTRALVMDKVCTEEGIEVAAEEIDAEVERMVGGAEDRAEELMGFFSLPAARESIERDLMGRKTLERLVSIAAGSDAESAAAGDSPIDDTGSEAKEEAVEEEEKEGDSQDEQA